METADTGESCLSVTTDLTRNTGIAHCLAKAAYTGALAATLIAGKTTHTDSGIDRNTVGKRTEQRHLLEVLTLSCQ
jgi:hypothetical protein